MIWYPIGIVAEANLIQPSPFQVMREFRPYWLQIQGNLPCLWGIHPYEGDRTTWPGAAYPVQCSSDPSVPLLNDQISKCRPNKLKWNKLSLLQNLIHQPLQSARCVAQSKGMTTYSHCPKWMQKIILFMESAAIAIWWYPWARSSLLKILACPNLSRSNSIRGSG